MTLLKSIILFTILSLTLFYKVSFSQESFLIKKKIIEDIQPSPRQVDKKNKLKSDINKKEINKKEKNSIKNTNSTTNNENEIDIEKPKNPVIFKNNVFRVIFKPGQESLSQEDTIKMEHMVETHLLKLMVETM